MRQAKGMLHGLINYKDTKTKSRHLNKLTCKGTLRPLIIRYYRLEIQSVMLVFSNQLYDYCPSNLLSGSPPPTPPPLPCVKVQYIQTVYSEPTKLLDHPKQKPRRGGGLRQINTCRKVPL
jgi:hypothetical protein